MKRPTKKDAQPAAIESARLTREDWLDEAFNAVAQGGIEKVKVLLLAEKLQVTRGSFYWHFADHADLIASLLARWRLDQSALDEKLKALRSNDPCSDLDSVLELALAHAGPDLRNMRFELALRGLGRRDAQVAQMLVEVDQARVDLFADKFCALVQDKKKATDLAALFYLALAGSYQALGRPVNPPQVREYLKSLISHYLIHQQVCA